MLSSNKKTSLNYLLGITLTSAIISLSGCGGDGGSTKSTPPDTSGVTDAKLKKSLKEGLTKGLSSNIDSLGKSLSNANSTFNNGSSSPKLLAGLSTSNMMMGVVNASDPIVDNLNEVKDKIVENLNLLIDNSTSTHTGNVYTFNPNESVVCNDLADTPSGVTKCISILQNVTFVSTINGVSSNNDVTAADTDFKYNTSTFSKLGFTNNSSYYQVEFFGLPDLLTAINDVSAANNQIDIPSSMTGSLKIASSAQTATSGTFTVSVPAAIAIANTSPATHINIGQTNNLFSVAADSSSNALTVNMSLTALDILTTQQNNQGANQTEQIILNAITGNATITNNGNLVTLTGVGANSIQFKINGTVALNASLATLGATINAANGQTTLTLSDALNFDLAMTNVNGFLDDSQPVTDTVNLNIDAPTGSIARKSTNNNGPKLVKVTTGSLTVIKSATGSSPVNSTVASGSCLNTNDLSVDTSANCQ